MASTLSTVQAGGRLIDVGGLELYVHQFDQPNDSGTDDPVTVSDRPTLLVVHGGPGGDHRNLVPPLAPLAAHAQLLFVDLRGHGLSGRPAPETCTVAKLADDLEALRRTLALDPRRLTVLGVSFGGIVALTLARRHPTTWPSLILSSAVASYRADGAWATWVRQHGTAAQAEAAEAIVGGRLRDVADARAAWRHVRPLYYADPAAVGAPNGPHPACLAEDVPEESIALVNWWYREGSREHDARPWLSSIRTRTLVLAGRADPLATLAEARTLASGIPGAQVEIFEQSGHLPQVEQPAEYLSAVRRFLEAGVLKQAADECTA